MRVRSLSPLLLAVAAIGLVACSSGSGDTPPPAPAGPDTCGMTPLRSHIGEPLDVTLLQTFENVIPSHRVRVLAPDTAATMDMVPERANVKTDAHSIIQDITCG